MAEYQKVCEHCGSEFVAKREWGRFCHQKCKDRFRKVIAPEKVRSARAKWGASERGRQSRQVWYAARKDERRDYSRAFYAKHAERLSEEARVRRRSQGTVAAALHVARVTAKLKMEKDQ